MKNRILFYGSIIVLVVLAVGLNNLTVYLKDLQSQTFNNSVWLFQPVAVLVFILWGFLLIRQYHKLPMGSVSGSLCVIIGLLVLFVPLIPAVALYLNLPYSVPFLQVAGALLVWMPWMNPSKK